MSTTDIIIDEDNSQKTEAEKLLFDLGFKTKRYIFTKNHILKLAIYYKDYFFEEEGEERASEPFEVVDSFWVYSKPGLEGIAYAAGSNVTIVYEKDLSQKKKDIIKLWKEERNLT